MAAVARDGCLDGAPAQLARDVILGHDIDVALALPDAIADQPVGDIGKAVAQDEDVAACDLGIVGKRQDVHVARAHGVAHGIRAFGEQGTDDDLRACVHGRIGLSHGLSRAGPGVIDTKVDIGALCIGRGHARRVLQAARQPFQIGRSAAARRQKGNPNRFSRVDQGTDGGTAGLLRSPDGVTSRKNKG